MVTATNGIVTHNLSITVIPANITDWKKCSIQANSNLSLNNRQSSFSSFKSQISESHITTVTSYYTKLTMKMYIFLYFNITVYQQLYNKIAAAPLNRFQFYSDMKTEGGVTIFGESN